MEVSLAAKDGVIEALSILEEKWLKAEQVADYFPCFSREWLKKNGHMLPRTRPEWTDEDGTPHRGPWCYPLHKINQMMDNGSIRRLTA